MPGSCAQWRCIHFVWPISNTAKHYLSGVFCEGESQTLLGTIFPAREK